MVTDPETALFAFVLSNAAEELEFRHVLQQTAARCLRRAASVRGRFASFAPWARAAAGHARRAARAAAGPPRHAAPSRARRYRALHVWEFLVSVRPVDGARMDMRWLRRRRDFSRV